MQGSPVGICWYRPEDYARLMAMFTDRQRLADTYEEWLKEAKKVSGTLTLEGFNIVKVYIDPETFPAWCKKNGLEMDAKARAQYALGIAQGKHPPKP
jgi:hypothetical protein